MVVQHCYNKTSALLELDWLDPFVRQIKARYRLTGINNKLTETKLEIKLTASKRHINKSWSSQLIIIAHHNKGTCVSRVTGETRAEGSVSLLMFNMTLRLTLRTSELRASCRSVWHWSNSDLKQKLMMSWPFWNLIRENIFNVISLLWYD